jgi:DNA-binding NarL/FixJ family response regulator
MLRRISSRLHGVNNPAHSNRPNRPCEGRFVNKLILVADDNIIMRDAVCMLFEFEEGLEVCEQAVNGQDAVEKAEQCRPDLIILDFSMPVMNGIDAARTLKAMMPTVPIILFTIHANEMLSEAAAEAGIDTIISKTNMPYLIERTRALLLAPSCDREM